MEGGSILPLRRRCQPLAFGVIRSGSPSRRPWRRPLCPWQRL